MWFVFFINMSFYKIKDKMTDIKMIFSSSADYKNSVH